MVLRGELRGRVGNCRVFLYEFGDMNQDGDMFRILWNSVRVPSFALELSFVSP
jgi:hypothetical protein